MTYIGRWSVDYEKAVVLGKGQECLQHDAPGAATAGKRHPIRVVLCDSWQGVLN
jgi:hypothetical protein